MENIAPAGATASAQNPAEYIGAAFGEYPEYIFSQIRAGEDALNSDR
jgi:hypothetical protein